MDHPPPPPQFEYQQPDEQIIQIRKVLQGQIQAFLLEAETTNPESSSLEDYQNLLIKANRFVECFGICLSDSVAAFGWSIESNRTINMVQAGYSEEKLYEFYHHIHQASCVILLNSRLTSLHGFFVSQMQCLYKIFYTHHPQILNWAVHNLLTLFSRVWQAVVETKDNYLHIKLETRNGQSYKVPFGLRSENLYLNFLSLQKLVSPYWDFFSGPYEEAQYLKLYLGTLTLGTRTGALWDICLKYFHPGIRPKSFKGLDVFAKTLCTVLKVCLGSAMESCGIIHWFQRNWNVREFSDEETKILVTQLGKHWGDLFLASETPEKVKKNSLQLLNQQRSVSFTTDPTTFNDSIGSWVLNWILTHPPIISINPDRLLLQQTNGRSGQYWLMGLYKESTLWLPLLSKQIGKEFDTFKATKGPTVLSSYLEDSKTRFSCQISPTWSMLISEWIQETCTFLQLHSQHSTNPNPPAPEKLLCLLALASSLTSLSKKFLADYLMSSFGAIARTSQESNRGFEILASSLFGTEFWNQLKKILEEAWSRDYSSKIWLRKLIIQKNLSISTNLAYLENIHPVISKILLSWITPWYPNEYQKKYLGETKAVDKIVHDTELLRRCTQTLSSKIFKSHSIRVRNILKLGLRLENPGILIGIFNLFSSVDPIVTWGLGRTENDGMQILKYFDNFVETKSSVYRNNFEMDICLAQAISRLPCALNLRALPRPLLPIDGRELFQNYQPCYHCDQNIPFEPDSYSKILLQATERILVMTILQSSTRTHPFIIDSIRRIRVHSGNSEPPTPLHKGFLLLGRSVSLEIRKDFLGAWINYHLPEPGEEFASMSADATKNINLAFLQLKSNLLDGSKGLALRVYHILDSLEPISMIRSTELSDEIIHMIIFLIYVQSNSGVSSRGRRLLTNIASSLGLSLPTYVREYRYKISELIVKVLSSSLSVGLSSTPDSASTSERNRKMSHVLSGLEVTLGLKHSDFKSFYIPVIFQIILTLNSHPHQPPTGNSQNLILGRDTLIDSFQSYYGSSSVCEMLELNFSTYWTNLVLQHPAPPSNIKFNINKVLRYLKTKDVNPELVASISLQTLMNELLSHLSTDRTRVLLYMNSLILWQKGRVHRVPVKSGVSKEEALEFIIPRLTGFYMYVHKIMDSVMEGTQRKRDTFLSLIQLMEWVGPAGVTPTRGRITTLFNSMLKYSWIKPLLIGAWKVYSMNLDDSALPGVMSQVLSVVLHLHKIQGLPLGNDFDQLCSYFILEKKDVDPTGVQDVFYIESYSTNPQILAVLGSAKRKGLEHFEFITNAIRNSNCHIQYQSLLAMRRVLTGVDQCIHIQDLIQDSRLMHPQVTLLVLALIHASTSPDPEVSNESLKILGELGALDYYRLRPPAKDDNTDSRNSFVSARPHSPLNPDPYFITTDAFAITYLKTIARFHLVGHDPNSTTALGLPKSQNYDLYGLTLQQTVKIWEVEAKDTNPIWKNLHVEEQALITPFLSSKYNVRDSSSGVIGQDGDVSYPNPIYGSVSHGPDHGSWVTSFTHLLYSFLKPGPVKEFFKVNFHIVGKGLGISELLLTRILLYATIEGSPEQRNLIRQELTAVCIKLLKKEFRHKRESQGLLDIGSISFSPDSENGDSGLDSTIDLANPSGDPSRSSAPAKCLLNNPRTDTQSIDLVFSIIDMISTLARFGSRDFHKLSNLAARGLSESVQATTANKFVWYDDPVRIQYVQLPATFVQDIYSILPEPRFLAQAAVQLESYPRALLLIEEFLHYFPEKLEENFPLLQRIYVALEDVDSVLGISEKRKRKPTIFEDTLDLLVSGKKESALNNFDVIIQKQFHEFMSQEALLQSYLAVATPQMALTILDGITSRKGSSSLLPRSRATYSSLLQECRIEACVKLGKWDDIGLDIRPSNNIESGISSSWTVAHATALLQFQKTQYSDALGTISKSRGSLLSHLSQHFGLGVESQSTGRPISISLETYQQSYGDVGRLHILAEMEQAISIMSQLDQELQNSTSETVDEVLNTYKTKLKHLLSSWSTRLDHVQKSIKIWDPILSSQKALLSLTRTIIIDKAQRIGDEDISELANYFVGPIREASLQMAKLELKDRNFARAYSYIHEARVFSPCPEVYLEEAKYLGLKGNVEHGIRVLTNSLNHYFPTSVIDKWISATSQDEVDPSEILAKSQCSRLLLALARFQDSQCLVDIDQNIQNYKKAALVNRKCEKNYFSLASYYYSALTAHSHLQENKDKKREYEVAIVKYYCKSLQYGCKHVYQSLPRLLTTWFDFGTREIPKSPNEQASQQAIKGGPSNLNVGANRGPDWARKMIQGNPSIFGPHGQQPPHPSNLNSQSAAIPPFNNPALHENALKSMTKSIDCLLRSVPEYTFFTSFSQLISRICHSNPLVWHQLKSILIRLILAHPHQALWNLMAVLKSTYSVRKLRCEEILLGATGKNKIVGLLIRDYPLLAANFIQLANYHIPQGTRFADVSQIAPALLTLFRGATFSRILLPFNEFLSLNLSRTGTHPKDHNPFSTDPVYFTIGTPSGRYSTAASRVEIMHSLVRPKKVPVIGSNGKIYHILVKPADDLRKDCKVMELNGIVNWYLGKRADARERSLHVNTYAVVPLNEETGLLEWVPGLAGLRGTLSKIYRDKKLGLLPRELKLLYPTRSMPLDEKRRVFQKEILKKYPPVFREWFLDAFPDPREWWTARRNYVYTAGVMSMVGFVIGLGDRHGENILVQTTNGEIVHVDFNCIFNKGETLDIPERVPFRLTRNLVDAMGPLGWNGPFRKSCEITLRIFRENSQVFLSILEAFVYDPLVEWSKTKNKRGNVSVLSEGAPAAHLTFQARTNSGELSNQRAKENLTAIAHRLDGRARNLTTELNVSLSVEAQVNYLIREATDVDNLCQMYVGWGSYF